MEHGVEFKIGDKVHHSSDWNLLLSSFDMGIPAPKTEYVDIVGGNGNIDLTEVYGEIFYDSRKGTIEFTCLDSVRFDETLDKMMAFLHGQECHITVYYDELYYYVGRVSVNKYKTSKALANITLSITAEPYKLKQYETILDVDVSEETEINCLNDRMECVPTIITDAPMNITFKGASYAVSTGETVLPDILFTEGSNILKVTGNGNIKIKYQEGRL